MQLLKKLSEMQKYIEGGRRLFEFLDAPEEELRPAKAEPDFGAENAIELTGINFQYAEADHKLFEDFSMTIRNIRIRESPDSFCVAAWRSCAFRERRACIFSSARQT